MHKLFYVPVALLAVTLLGSTLQGCAKKGDTIIVRNNGGFTLGGSGGSVTPGLSFVAGSAPSSVAAWEPQTVEIQLADAGMNPISGATVTLALGANPGEVLVHASHQSSGGTVQLVDPLTPTLLDPIIVGDAGGEMSGLYWDATSKTLLLLDTSGKVAQVNLSAGTATPLPGAVSTSANPRGLSRDGMGRVLVGTGGDDDSEDIEEVDLATGNSTFVGNMTLGAGVRTTQDLALDPSSGTLYACIETDPGDDNFRNLMILDPMTLALTDVARFGGGATTEIPMASLACFTDGTLFGLTGESGTLSGSPQETVVRINKADGTFTNVLTLGQGDDGEALAVMPARLRGSLTAVTDAKGIATFSGLFVDMPASGYTLVASSAGQSDLTSASFDATSPVVTGVVELSATTSTFSESDGTVTPCSVTINPAQKHDVWVWLSIDDDVAGFVNGPPNTGNPSTAGSDLGFANTTVLLADDDGQFVVRIPAGSTSVPLEFTLVNDGTTEATEVFTVYIGNELGTTGSVALATPGANLTHTMTITDDD